MEFFNAPEDGHSDKTRKNHNISYKSDDDDVVDNFYQMLLFIRRHEIFFYTTGPFSKLQTKIPKISIFENAFSRHANLTQFCRIVHIDVRNTPWQFQIDISKIDYFTEQSVKWRQMLVCKIQNGL